jgi:hypothetical protein
VVNEKNLNQNVQEDVDEKQNALEGVVVKQNAIKES